MIKIDEIEIIEFENDIYDKYIMLFPKEEQREWKDIKKAYENDVEKFYKICLDDEVIGFFMLEKLDDKPYYLDYFAIYRNYQGMGYGSLALKMLIEKIKFLVCEIESIDPSKNETVKRYKFYEKLGFKKIDSLYLLYGVNYVPLIYGVDLEKSDVDKLFFSYYNFNCGRNAVILNCKIIK